MQYTLHARHEGLEGGRVNKPTARTDSTQPCRNDENQNKPRDVVIPPFHISLHLIVVKVEVDYFNIGTSLGSYLTTQYNKYNPTAGFEVSVTQERSCEVRWTCSGV